MVELRTQRGDRIHAKTCKNTAANRREYKQKTGGEQNTQEYIRIQGRYMKNTCRRQRGDRIHAMYRLYTVYTVHTVGIQ